MVGVPGRSKGCSTCRKRRIACSLERPECHKCVKSRRACGGYQRERVFVTSVPDKADGELQWRQSAYQARCPSPINTPGTQQRTGPISLYAVAELGLKNTAAKQYILGLVLDGFHATAQPGIQGDGSHWFSNITSQTIPSEPLETAMLALCTARLARSATLHQKPLRVASEKLYGDAMQAVRRSLSCSTLAFEAETLGACWLLSMYEVYECPGAARTAYEQHFNGCARLVELRGPKAHQEGMAHSLFLAFRTMGALESLVRRKTFLSKHEWRTVPFEKVTKTPFDLLIDIVLDGPALLTRAGQLERLRSPQAFLLEARSIVRSCHSIVDDLGRLFKDIEQSVAGPLHWPVFSKLEKEMGMDQVDYTPLFPTQHEFIDIRIGTTLALYWGILIVVLSAIAQLNGLVKHVKAVVPAKEKVSTTCMSFDEVRESMEVTFMPEVRNVCQSVQYCMQHDIGLPFIMAPLNIVVQTLKQWPAYEKELKWARQALTMVKANGVQMAAHLPQDEDRLYDRET